MCAQLFQVAHAHHILEIRFDFGCRELGCRSYLHAADGRLPDTGGVEVWIFVV